ncbi:hypothetical protein ATR1_002d0042 [Acetobacter tropicalis]|nr:hypothetical protein ATR1_002d0042 [Acetobacter tropicalis]
MVAAVRVSAALVKTEFNCSVAEAVISFLLERWTDSLPTDTLIGAWAEPGMSAGWSVS